MRRSSRKVFGPGAWGGLSRRAVGMASAAAICLSGVALGQASIEESPPDSVKVAEKTSPRQLGADALAAFTKGDYAKAEALLRRQLEAEPESFVAWYNLACCRAMQGDGEGACDHIAEAIANGFCDRLQLERDPTLAAARPLPKFQAILDHWPEILDARRDAGLKRAELLFNGRDYANATDERLKIAYRSAFNAKAFGEAREEIGRIADWANEELFGDILDNDAMKEDAWAMVILPTRPDFMRWVVSVYGPDAIRGNSMIGGAYEHDQKQLVSMDIGATMRHEFLHVLHWRSCTRLGQYHAIWIMEGLCSLVEDYEVVGNKLRPVTSWRTNMAQRMDRVRSLLPIEQLASMSQLKFTGARPLGNYAQARSFFLYLYDQGKLKEWYAHYTANFKEDPTGVKSIEAVLEVPIAEVNKSYRSWLRGLPPVPEMIKSGSASLGIEVDSGSGEGPVVTQVDRAGRNMLDKQTALRKGDIITSIDGRAVRDIAELVRVLGGFKVGDEVEVEYRRMRKFASTKVRLVAR